MSHQDTGGGIGASLTVLFLTHKRAGAVVAFRPETTVCLETTVGEPHAPPSSVVHRVVHALEQGDACLETTPEGLLFLRGEAVVVGLGGSQTAEILARLYAEVLSRMNACDAHVGELQVVVGPGSFTGLRLGCAFANGLVLGHSSRVLSPLIAARPHFVASAPERWPVLARVPQGVSLPVDDDDPFSAPVSFADVVAQLEETKPPRGEPLFEFVPAYGREPGPVLKLRSQGGSV